MIALSGRVFSPLFFFSFPERRGRVKERHDAFVHVVDIRGVTLEKKREWCFRPLRLVNW